MKKLTAEHEIDKMLKEVQRQPKKKPCYTFAILVQVESLNRELLQTLHEVVKSNLDSTVNHLLKQAPVKADNTLFTQRYSAIRKVEARCQACGAPVMSGNRPLCACPLPWAKRTRQK